MSNDIQFTPKYVLATNENLVQMQAVLYPILGGCDDDEQRKAKVMALVETRRERVSELRRSGWLHVQDDCDFKFIRNCLPTMVAVKERVRSCNRRYFCPFCYARSAADTYRTVADAAFSSRARDCELLCRVKNVSIPFDADIKSVTANVKKEWSPIMKSLGAVGGYFSIVLSPAVSRPTIDLSIRFAVLIREGTKLPSWITNENYDLRKLDSHVDLVTPVATICEYPKGLMTGDPDLMCDILDQREGLRLAANFGIFRTKTQKETR